MVARESIESFVSLKGDYTIDNSIPLSAISFVTYIVLIPMLLVMNLVVLNMVLAILQHMDPVNT